MKVEKDYEDFIKLLNDHKVKYLVVGAYAVAIYAFPRNTGDIDFFIERSEENAEKIIDVIKEFGFETLEITKDVFLQQNNVIWLGVPPVRIDILTSISGVAFEEAYLTKTKVNFGNTYAYFISKEFLMKNKKASGRKKDLLDYENLSKTRENNK